MYNIQQCTARLSRTFRIGRVCQGRYYSSAYKSSNSKDLGDSGAVPQEQTEDPVPEKVQVHQTENASNDEDESETVNMWNKDAVAGPEWNGPRGYEPTKFGDWSTKGRVTDF